MISGNPDPPSDPRRREIIAAAKACFLQFGYDRTTLQDIARRVGIARPLIYLIYPNKLAILAAVYDDLFALRYPRAGALLARGGAPSAILVAMCDILILEPWAEMMGSAMAVELMAACADLSPELEAAHAARQRALFAAILGSDARAAVFQLAAEGLQADTPPLDVLRARLAILIDSFASGGQTS